MTGKWNASMSLNFMHDIFDYIYLEAIFNIWCCSNVWLDRNDFFSIFQQEKNTTNFHNLSMYYPHTVLVFVYSLRAILRSNRIICHIFCSCREIDLLLQIFRESISHKMIIKRMHICVDVVDSAHLFYEPIKYFNVKHLFENAVSCKYIMEWKLLYLRWLKCQGYLKWFPYFGFPWTALKIYPVIVVISIAGKQVATLSMKLVHLSWCCLITRCENIFIRDFLQPITIFLTIGGDFK